MEKGIFCVEGLWDKTTDSQRPSVSPLLDFLGRTYKVKHTKFDCGTIEELQLRLSRSRKYGYGILYVSYHGSNGIIQLENQEITLPKLAEIMKDRFRGWYVHFWSCLTLSVDVTEIKKFKRKIGAHKVSGYRKEINWADVNDSAPLELAWMSSMIQGKNKVPDEYRALVRRNGLIIV